MKIHISFDKLVDRYRAYLDGDDALLKARASHIIGITEDYPELLTGITEPARLFELQPQMDDILADLFSDVLQNNEIKVASLPFNEEIIKSSRRYKKIIAEAGPDFKPEISNFKEDHSYIMGCSIILNQYYGYKIDFRRPFYYDIPDASGIMRHYRLLYNGDYISIEKGKEAMDITDEDVAELLDNFENIDLWKTKFPPRSWNFKGFVIANLYDATTDVSLSDFKTTLLKYDKTNVDFITGFQDIFKSIFNLTDLEVGYSNYNKEEGILEGPPDVQIKSFILNKNLAQACKTALCSGSYHTIFTEHQFFAISDVEKYYNYDTSEPFYKNLLDQDIQSAIFAPVTSAGEFLGILEIVSPLKHVLNSINANKLLDILPYLVDSVLSQREQMENELEVIIQNECTSIHPSVYWKFRQEAKRVMQAQLDGDTSVSFRDIVFKGIYPLFGQIDIKGSAQARNTAVQRDLLLQLNKAKEVITEAIRVERLPVYEELEFRISAFITKISDHLQVDSERGILNFFANEIHPLFEHLEEKKGEVAKLIYKYNNSLEKDKDFIYQYRKDYDDSVMLINKRMAAVLDKKQLDAQLMYPHFFERFKTDGVEHNMYIGEAITREKSFNKIYLYNLRLWQLQVMCEMENEHYKLSRKLPHPLDVASMILVFNGALAVRFRMDEKHFDVDGTYNARYEVVKKRVDKAYIKGTNERITQKGKIAIVYSQKEDELEYMRYIEFLQSKNYLGAQVEVVELQDLQAVTGLKAIRVEVLYAAKKGQSKKFYTYDDLMLEIKG